LSWSMWYDYTTDSADTNAPAAFGVYELGDNQRNTLYYGSGNIRSRLLEHMRKREYPLTRYFRYERTESEERALEREEALLDEYIKRFGKPPTYAWRLG